MTNIKKNDDIKLENIKYLPIQNKNEYNKYIKIRYKENKEDPLIIQTPYFYIPLGIGTNQLNNYNFLDLSFNNEIDEIELKNFKIFLNSIDKKIINDAFEYKKEWFINEYNELDQIENIYRKQVNNSFNDLSNFNFDYLRVYLPKFENNWDFEIYDENKNNITNNKISLECSYCRFILICDGLWFNNDNFGISWRVAQIQCKEIHLSNNFIFKDYISNKNI